ncbi:MAG: hypothetical protein JWM86_1436 [Thermoleophilia bacterium]|nr:hypothetical protein [Thermoleophilia bacterium]
MSEAPESPADSTLEPTTSQPRSTAFVLGVLGAIVALPLLVIVLVLLTRGGNGGGADELLDGIREDRLQAVYLTDGSVYFGDLRAGNGDWLDLRDAFFLRRTEAAAKDGAAAKASTDLVPIGEVLGGDGDMTLNATEVLQVQDLAKDAEIATAIDDAVG